MLRSNLAKPAAFLLLEIMTLNLALPAVAALSQASSPLPARPGLWAPRPELRPTAASSSAASPTAPAGFDLPARLQQQALERAAMASLQMGSATGSGSAEDDNGGPSQPEMSSFKPAGADNLVNLFTGDFNYNIPLMDVGGYPINIFYDGNISPEQDASWVGLGWNINPGSITRNLRGVPDDFSGEEKLKQEQDMKPNRTWGANVGADFELFGSKTPRIGLNVSVGFSYNNYLGPSTQLGLGLSASQQVFKGFASEKAPFLSSSALSASGSVNATLDSRSGLTFTPSASLTSRLFQTSNIVGLGGSISTSYNSRVGVASLNLSVDASKLSASRNIQFAKPSYTPTIRVPMLNSGFTGRFQLGASGWGAFGSATISVNGNESEVAQKTQIKPLYGYLYHHKAQNDRNGIMDFTRLNDQEVTPETPIISAPQYATDIFSIQGEGTGGSVRLYRNDLGSVRDNYTVSKTKSISAGADVSIFTHFGVNLANVQAPAYIGPWQKGNNLQNVSPFLADGSSELNEVAALRSPDEKGVIETGTYNSIGGVDLVRHEVTGTAMNPVLTGKLIRNNVLGQPLPGGLIAAPSRVFNQRKKRTQVTSFLTAAEADLIGLTRTRDSYAPITAARPLSKNALFETLKTSKSRLLRQGDFTGLPDGSFTNNANQISEITVLENGGKRYVYGLPVYNLIQKEYSFSVTPGSAQQATNNLVSYATTDATTGNPQLGAQSDMDGYVNISTTPAYAHSFLITGLLSPDYVDVKGDGITEDDLGTAVRFNYTHTGNNGWRTPNTPNTAHFNNGGTASHLKDDKGIVTWGVRENWHLHSIESKTMIAIFRLASRSDARNVDSLGGLLGGNISQRLERIDLYNKADVYMNGLGQPIVSNGAQPIKSVHFAYNYSLCEGGGNNGGGKLTLTEIFFSFNNRGDKGRNHYYFNYGSYNPGYTPNSTDRWGTFKRPANNPPYNVPASEPKLTNDQYPYAVQTTERHEDAAAWMLKKITTPSGSSINVEYESDDYAYVQDHRATRMFQIAGFGEYPSSTPVNELFSLNSAGVKTLSYVFIDVPEACGSKEEVIEKYLKVKQQLAFSLWVKMPKGPERIVSYADVDWDATESCGGIAGTNRIFFKMKLVEGMHSPVALTAIEFLRQRLPAQAYKGYDLSSQSGLKALGTMLAAMFDALGEPFKDPVFYLQGQSKARIVELNKTFVRLIDPVGKVMGGGVRVKKVTLTDNWDKMTRRGATGGGEAPASYGQTYDYTTYDPSRKRVVSSGVAAYEPAIGGEQNPLHFMRQFAGRLPLGPASYGAVEMPVLDAFFPGASVGYSKVTVQSLQKTLQGALARSTTGRQVTEYYTAKDFPVRWSNTAIDPTTSADFQHQSFSFLNSSTVDGKYISQGFLVVTNDMHGQMMRQSYFSAKDPGTAQHKTEYFYSNTGDLGLSQTYKFLQGPQGVLSEGHIGIDVELMTDTREFRNEGWSTEDQAQVDLIGPLPVPPFPLYLPIPMIYGVNSSNYTVYRAVTTTKHVSYRCVVDKVVVTDKGSVVATENLAYDAETGEVLVTKSNNAFGKPVYNVKVPAHWSYGGMEPAYKNIDKVFSGLDFQDGRLMGANQVLQQLESGDELFIMDDGANGTYCQGKLSSSPDIRKIWAFNTHKGTDPYKLSDANKVLNWYFIDRNGLLYNRSNVTARIVRSGKRNMAAEAITTLICLENPLPALGSGNLMASFANDAKKVLNAAAVEYKEKWQADRDVVFKAVLNICTNEEEPSCTGDLQKRINPYTKGLLGTYRAFKSWVPHLNRAETDPSMVPALRTDGSIAGFTSLYAFSSAGLQPLNPTNWQWKTESLRFNSRGMEVESKNPLEIRTAAQYGYSKSVPVAITQNSEATHTLYEGFEHSNYTDQLHSQASLYCDDYARFLPIPAGTALQAGSGTSHSGKSNLYVTATSNLEFSTASPSNAFAPFIYPRADVTTFANPGFTYNEIAASTYNAFAAPQTIMGRMEFNGALNYVEYQPNPCLYGFSFSAVSEAYFVLENFLPEIGINTSSNVGISPSSNAGVTVEIQNVDVPAIYVYQTVSMSSSNLLPQQDVAIPVNLCAGRYRVKITLSGSVSEDRGPNCNVSIPQGVASYYHGASVYPFASMQPYLDLNQSIVCQANKPLPAEPSFRNPAFSIPTNKRMILSYWIKEESSSPVSAANYSDANVDMEDENGVSLSSNTVKGNVIDGWQQVTKEFTLPTGKTPKLAFKKNTVNFFVDDLRIHPYEANMKSFVYDPVTLRLMAELDENNYATFYEYDEEGTLVRKKRETAEGIKTITETRSSLQNKSTNY